MKDCPVCQKKFTNAGLAAHITKAHPSYREKQAPDPLEEDAVPTWKKVDIMIEDLEKSLMPDSKPVYKQTSSRKVRTLRKPQVETTQSGIVVRKLKIMPKTRPPRMPREPKDPEGTLNLITRIPAIVITFASIYYVVTHLGQILALKNNEIVELYRFLLATPTNPISILILAITVSLIIGAIILVHKLAWRMMFPDLYLRQFKVVGNQKVFIGSSREARAYLTIGAGRWDRLYRRITKRPRPEVITVYFKDSWRPMLNPFNPINNMEKGYIVDPKHERFVKSGLFRVTVGASHKRRDVENNMPVYWFEDAEADQLPFSEKWYVKSHDNLIDVGLRKVSRATNLDSEVQKAQAEKSLLWLPRQDVEEQYELAKAIEDSQKVIKP